MIPTTSVGIDYHKDTLQICVMDVTGKVRRNRKVRNDLEEAIGLIGKRSPGVVVAAEACNGSASFLDALHQQTGWQVKLCHPGYAQRMRNNPDKTDKADSELIADLSRIGYLPEVWLAPEELRDLRALVRYRAVEMAQARAMKCRIKALLRNNRVVVPGELSLWTRAGKKWLSDEVALPVQSQWVLSRYARELERFRIEVAEATKRMSRFVKQDTFCRKLLEQRGIGIVTAALMRAEIGTFSRFKTGKQLARFCGVSPCNRSSGEIASDCGLIRAGNPILKSCIAQSVWTLIRHDAHWKAFATTLLARGKPKGVVAAAVANRWIRKLFHSVKEL